MKKLCTLLALVLLLTCIPMAGCTPEPEPNPPTDFEYEINEDGEITIKKYIGEVADVVVPEKIEKMKVTRIGNAAFEECTRLTSIVLPSSLQEIGNYAFAKCTNLKQIHIPADCLTGWSIFQSSGLEQITFADEVTTIPMGCFEATKLVKIVCPPSLISIESSAFHMCAELTEITLNHGLTSVGTNVFQATAITEMVIPATVQSIKDTSFPVNMEKIYFEGNAPDGFLTVDPPVEKYSFTIHYHQDAEGFTSPEWNGYPTEIW